MVRYYCVSHAELLDIADGQCVISSHKRLSNHVDSVGVVSMCVHDVLLLLAECSTSYIFQQHGMSHPLDKDY